MRFVQVRSVMKQFVYADNAATTKLDSEAFDAMKIFLLDEYGNASQPYSFAREPKKALAEARQIIAAAINAQPEEVYFTSGGTESDNWAIKGSALLDSERRGIITSSIEHHAILRACEAVERLGYPVTYINSDSKGLIHPEVLKSHITDKTHLVSVMFSNNEIGTIEPIKDLATIAHKNGSLFHTDAVQAIGHVRLDVKELDVDMLSASAHKFNGPKGVGFLYIKKEVGIAPLNDGGSQESGLRAGTENIPYIVGMAVALKNNIDNLAENEKHLLKLENLLLSGLSGLDFVRNGAEKHIPGNISLSFRDRDGEAILHRLDLAGISVSTGSACDSVNTQISHVLKAIGLDERYAKGTIRISLGKDNTEEDVKAIVHSLKKILLP